MRLKSKNTRSSGNKQKLKLTDIETVLTVNKAKKSSPLNSRPKNVTTENKITPQIGFPTHSELGTLLKNNREKMGIELSHISQNLRIRREYLEAIEEGEFHSLPGQTYTIGFVRSYAKHLGLDVERSVALFKTETEGINAQRPLVFPSPAPEGKVPGGAMILIATVLGIGSYFGWYYLNMPENVTNSHIQPISEISSSANNRNSNATTKPEREKSIQNIPPILTKTKAIQKQENIEKYQTVRLHDNHPLEIVAKQVMEKKVSSKIKEKKSVIVPVKEKQIPPHLIPKKVNSAINTDIASLRETKPPVIPDAPTLIREETKQPDNNQKVIQTLNAPKGLTTNSVNVSRVIIQATQDSWLQIQAPDSSSVMTRVMRAGEVYNVPNRSGLRLSTGNAGAIKITVDGYEIEKLGKIGHIVRNIDLDPIQLKRLKN